MIITDESELKKECRDVSLFEAQDIIYKLELELAKSKTGIGLAANQIGINAKVCIIKLPKVVALVNPVIVSLYDLRLFKNEGCLSYPDQFILTKRYNEVLVRDSLHPSGIICTGLEAVVVQHEVGHLYGEVMYNYMIKEPSGPNDICWCGNGKKYKLCHFGKTIKSSCLK